MSKVSAGFNFYGCMADAVLSKKADSKAKLFPALQPAKRTYEEVKQAYPDHERDPSQKKRLRKGASPLKSIPVKAHKSSPKRRSKSSPARNKKQGNETDSMAEDSAMEDDAGGSSQDRYESDFIDDGGREEIEARKKQQLKKGQIDESEEEAYVTKSVHSESSS